MKTLNYILLIDDNQADNDYHVVVIKQSGMAKHVISFTDSRAALQYLKESLETLAPVPDLIFLDILMPRIDGFELLDEFKSMLRANPSTDREIKVFILSGGYDPVMEIYLNSPNYDDIVTGYRLKPLTKEILKEIVENHF